MNIHGESTLSLFEFDKVCEKVAYYCRCKSSRERAEKLRPFTNRDELLTALKPQHFPVQKKWLKSHEVRRLLKISPGTLQTLKSSGIIPYTKIGGVHFFDYEDIQRVLESGKINNR